MMSLDPNASNLDLRRLKPSIVFDAESVALLGKFGDQLAAYRAKRAWVQILQSHFLLESERDYEISVASSHENGMYVLSCNFTSACGRYSFWRLINHQAPDAENKICQASKAKAIEQGSYLLRSDDAIQLAGGKTLPWLLTGISPKPTRSIGNKPRGPFAGFLDLIFGARK